jgi:hypothetical protein
MVSPTWITSYGEAPITNEQEYLELTGTPMSGNVTGAAGVACNAAGIPQFVKRIPAVVLYEGAPPGIPAAPPVGALASYNDWEFDLYFLQQEILGEIQF